MTETCAARELPGLDLCAKLVTEQRDIGCVHEHVKRVGYCEDHPWGAGEIGCYECLLAGHDCEMFSLGTVARV